MYQIMNTVKAANGRRKPTKYATEREARKAADFENMADDYGCWIVVKALP